MAVSLRHLAQREPAAAAMRWAALRDVLHGPGWLHRDLSTVRDRAVDTARREIVAPHPVSAVAGTVSASARLLQRWSQLGRQYRAALPEVTSTRRWEQTFSAAEVLERPRPTWSIIVTSFHSQEMLTKHWERLLQDGELHSVPEHDVEVIVVDNADEPEVEEFARRQGFRYLPMGSNVGLSAANNRGAELATGRYLLFANPDLGVKVPAALWRRGWTSPTARPRAQHEGGPICGPSWLIVGWHPRPLLSVTCGRWGRTSQGPSCGAPGERRRCPERSSTGSAAGRRSTSSTWRMSSSASGLVSWAYPSP
jgi:hypothetical protein